jgi:hypothetical protein
VEAAEESQQILCQGFAPQLLDAKGGPYHRTGNNASKVATAAQELAVMFKEPNKFINSNLSSTILTAAMQCGKKPLKPLKDTTLAANCCAIGSEH